MKFTTTAYHKLTNCTVAYRVILSLVTLTPYRTHEAANSRWSGHTEGALEAPRAAPEQVDEFPTIHEAANSRCSGHASRCTLGCGQLNAWA